MDDLQARPVGRNADADFSMRISHYGFHIRLLLQLADVGGWEISDGAVMDESNSPEWKKTIELVTARRFGAAGVTV